MGKQKFYAVHNGREGTQIYTSWEETKANVSRFSGAIHKSFRSLPEARAWLLGIADAAAADAPPPYSYPGAPPSQPKIEPPTQAGISQMPIFHVKEEDVGDLVDEDFFNRMDVDNQPGSSRITQPPPTPQDIVMQTQAPPTAVPIPAPTEEIKLSSDQQRVLDMVKQGKNVFFTGSAGTGKSVLLREIIKLRGGRPSLRLGVTASTGIASVNIGGCTLHSWAGIGLGKEDKERLVGKILGISFKELKRERLEKKKREMLWARHRLGELLTPEEEQFMRTPQPPKEDRKSRVLDRWRECRTLIIDEISMIDGKLFDKLEFVARELRDNQLPFGGIQLVLSGDFCQLPPVPDKSGTGAQIPATFAFDAKSWNRCVGPPVILTQVFRQKDQAFVNMLNAMRFGKLHPEAVTAFRNLSREVHYDDGIEPTELYPTRAEVESANSSRLNKLPDNPILFRARDLPGRDEKGDPLPPQRVERALKDVIAPEKLNLKVGAQVMLVKNIIQGVLVNGSVGRVVGFYKPRDALAMGIEIALPDRRERNEPDIPLRIIDEPEDANTSTQPTQPDPTALAGSQPPDARAQRILQILQLNTVWPAVQFENGPTQLCVPLTFEVVNAEGTVEAIRDQVPLILAWALSIHKSQGQTLHRVTVNLNRIFEKGQAYVALSRATRMETLQVVNFDPARVLAHPRVLQWMAEHAGRYNGPEYIQERDLDDELEYWQDVL